MPANSISGGPCPLDILDMSQKTHKGAAFSRIIAVRELAANSQYPLASAFARTCFRYGFDIDVEERIPRALMVYGGLEHPTTIDERLCRR